MWLELHFNNNFPFQVTSGPPFWRLLLQRKDEDILFLDPSQLLGAALCLGSLKPKWISALSLPPRGFTLFLWTKCAACCFPLPGVVFPFPQVWTTMSLAPAPGYLVIMCFGKKQYAYPLSCNRACCNYSISWKNINCHKGHKWSLWTWNNHGEWNVLIQIVSGISLGSLPLGKSRWWRGRNSH